MFNNYLKQINNKLIKKERIQIDQTLITQHFNDNYNFFIFKTNFVNKLNIKRLSKNKRVYGFSIYLNHNKDNL